MEISWIQAILLGLCACLSSMPGMGGSSIGNYTLGRPLVGGLVCGLILGDITTGILVGCAMQVVYIALVTPGGTVSADVRAVSYIGIPLAMAALSSYGLDAATSEGTALATSFGTMVGTLGTVLFYGTATINLVWQHIGWKAVEKRQYKKLYLVGELYDNEDDKANAMNTYTAFFNTEPQLGSVIVGITAGLEEARASGQDDVDEETINGLRAGLMGPIAGIGDSLVVGTVFPILLGIA